MVLTAEEKANNKTQANKKYQKENKEKILERQREYRKNNRERTNQLQKGYRERHKEKLAQQRKEYRENNLESIKQLYNKRRSNVKTVEKDNERKKIYGKTKKGRISSWKNTGIILNEDTYEKFEEATHCESCNVEFEKNKGNKRKCLDHHHASGHVRNIICSKCNLKKGVVDRLHKNVLLELHRYFIRLSISF
jgi:hypothetical protein